MSKIDEFKKKYMSSKKEEEEEKTPSSPIDEFKKKYNTTTVDEATTLGSDGPTKPTSKVGQIIASNFDRMGSAKGIQGYEKYLSDASKTDNTTSSAWDEQIIRNFTTSNENPINQIFNNVVYNYRNDDSYMRPNDKWSSKEKSEFGELYLDNPDAAFAYAEKVNAAINKREEEKKTDAIQRTATEDFGSGYAHTVGSIATAPFAVADYLDDLAKVSAGREIAPDGIVSPFEYSQAVTGGISEHLNEVGGTIDESVLIFGGKGWGDVYGLGTSIAQSMASAYTLGGTGTLISYFGQGAAAGVDDALSRGASEEQALLYGTALGIAEGLAEKVGVDNLFKLGSSSTVKGLIKNIIKQAGAEGGEELITSIASNIADNIIMQDKSNFNALVAQYTAQGLSEDEAKKKAWLDSWGDVAFDAIAGAVSGGISGGVHSSLSNVITNSEAKANYGDQVEDILIEAGTNANLSKSEGKYVDKYINKYGKKGDLSGGAISHLLEISDTKKVKSAVTAELNKLGEKGDVSKLADVITKKIQGIELTKSEEKIISKSTYGERILNTSNPSKIRSGMYASDWAEGIGTRRLNATEYNLKSNNPNSGLTPQKVMTYTPDDDDEDTLPKENATEAKIEAPKETMVTITKDGEKVEVKPQKITSFENGEMSLELEGGEVVNASEVDFGESGVGLVYQAAEDMSSRVGGFNVDTANVFVRGYNAESGQSAGVYINGWISAYKFGAQNTPISALAANPVTSKLTEEQRKTAYNFGRAFGNEKIVNTESKNDANISKTDSKKKKGRVIFDGERFGKRLKAGVGGDRVTERQRASLKTLNFLAKALGKDIYVEDLDPGDNGWYDPDTSDIHIGFNTGVNGEALLLFTTAHELTHDIKTRLGEKFNVLADAVYEEYTNKFGEADMQSLINDKIDHLKKYGDITENMTEEEAYDLAYEEVICDCLETMLVDSDAITALSKNIYAKDKGLWQRIKDFFARLVARIKAAYADVVPDSEEGQRFRDLGEGAERIKKLWVEAIVELSELGSDAKTDSGDVVNVIEDEQFYKVRGENAVRLSKAVDLTLTQETVNGKKVPMVGFPLRYFDTYAKKAAAKGITLKKATVKHSYSSITYSFFGDKKVTVKDFENGSYTKTEGYKRYVESCLNNMRQTSESFNEEAARKEIEDSIDGIVRVAVAMKKAGYDILDNHAKRSAVDSKNRMLFSSLEPNSDYFTSSDISTICDKRINFAEIYDEIVRREEAMGVPANKRFFSNVDNYFIIHDIMADKGLTQPCRECYVESMRKNLAPMANAFLELMQETDPDNKANKQLYQPSGKNKGELKSNNAKLRENLLKKIEGEKYDITVNNLTVEMLTTPQGLATLKLQAPFIYETFNSFYGQSKPKMPKEATPFRFGELTALLKDDNGKIRTGLIKQIMSTGGFRLQSYSDFQIQNFADVLQVIFEAGTLGLSGHAYTKVPAFLDATKGTNLKRNISIFMYNDGGEWKIDRNDSFPYDLEKIYDIVDSDESGNTSIIAVVQNEMMAAWIMANDNIGYFIPFHKSGMKMGTVRETIVKEGGREIKGYTGIKDHTRQQTEVWAKTTADHKANTKVKKGINIYEFWDFDNADNLSREGLIEKNVKAYIDACEKAGYLPKFREYVMNNSKVLNAVLNYSKQLGFVSQNATIDDISFEYKGYRIPYGYYKCLGDFGMFTPDGEASPIERLSLKDYNFDEAEAFFSNAETLRRNEILQQIANGEERERYRNSDMTTAEIAEEVQSKRNQVVEEVVSGEYKKKKYSHTASEKATYADSVYLDAVNRGDMETAQRMVDEAAKEWGAINNGNTRVPRPLHLYHGTGSFGFTRFRDGRIYATTAESVASGYNRGGGLARVRSSSLKYIPNDGTADTAIKNAKNVLGAELTKLDDANKQSIISKAKNILKEVATKVSELDEVTDYGKAGEFFEYLAEKYGEDKAIKWTNDLDSLRYMLAAEYTVEEILADGAWLKHDIEKYPEWKQSLSELWSEEQEAIKDSTLDKVFRYLLGYEYGDALIDIEFGLGRLLDNRQKLVNARGSLVYLEDIIDAIEMVKDTGIYDLYGHPGEKPLIIDEGKRFWDAIPFEGGFKSTDYIVNWAKEHDYTSVLFKTVLDPSSGGSANIYADEWVFFDSNQVKSADPVTYDDKGNVIPLSERFNTKNSDIRYSHKADKKATYAPTNGMKPRTLLANALEGAVTEDEKNLLQTYKDNIDKLNSEQEKLEKVMSEIDEIRFKKSLSILGEEMSVKTFESRAKAKAEKNGINAENVQFKLDRSNAKYIAYAVGHGTILEADKTFRSAEDNAKLNELWGEAKDISAQINTYDRELLKLQAMQPIKNVLQREKAMAYKRATEKAEVRRKESVEKVKESAAKTEAKIKLQKLILQTSKWISYPGKDDVKCPDILREPYAKFLEGIDLSSKRLLEGGAPTHNDDRVANAMNNLANAIERIKNAQDPSVDTDKVLDSGYLDLPVEFVGKLREMAENISKMMVEGDYVINRMSAADVKQLSKLIRTLNHAIKEMSTLYASLRFANIEALGDNSITFLEAMGEAKNTNAVADFVGWDNALPYYAFKRFGEGGEAIFEGLMDGQDKLARLAKMIFDFKDKTWTDKESKAWGEDTHTIELPSGNTLTLTTADAMGIYCLSRREQGLQHLLGGGTRVIGIKKGTKKAADSRSTLTQEDINAIVASLTDRQKQVALDIQKFMSEVCAEWGNEISMKRFLTKEFTDPNYYPIESNDENLAAKDPQAQKSDLYRLLNISATKPLAPGANNEVIIRNIFDVFVEHASDMAKLNAYGLPLLDYMKWVNYREKTSNDNGQIKVRGVHKSMTTAYGDKAWSYVLNLIKDVNGRFNDNADNSFLMNMMRMQKTASVGNNLRVAFLQFTSYPRASLVLSVKSLALGLTKRPQIEKAKKYCGIALWKSFGFYDTNIARSIEDQLKGTTSIRQKIIELTMKGPEWADAITWGALWNACEYEVAKTTKNKVGSEEFYQEVGLKLREVVYATQVVDSILTRSQIMRSKSGLTQTATAYMSEPTLTANILMDAAFQFQKEKRISGSAKTAWKKTGKIVIGAVGNYLILQLITSIAESLADAWRDDDEEEFLEKFGEAFGENLITNLIPFNKIPIISDIADLLLSFFGIGFVSSDNLSTSWLTQAANAVKAWSEVLGEAFGDKEDENYKETSKTVYNAIYQTAKALSSMSGVSVSGAMREVVAVWNNTAGAIDPTLKIRQYDLTGEENRKGLYEAMISGDENKVAWYEATYEDDSAIQSAIRKALRENDPRIKEAAKAKMGGDYDEYERIADEIEREGHFSMVNIKAAIKSEVNALTPEDTTVTNSSDSKDEEVSIYDPSDINVAFENGDTALAKKIIADIVEKKVANGKTEKEAKSSLRSSMTSYWKPIYKKASESERIRIRKILYNSGLYGNADEVVKSVDGWLKD